MNVEIYQNRQKLTEDQEGYLIELKSSESGTIFFFQKEMPRTTPGDMPKESGFLGSEQNGNYTTERHSHGKHKVVSLGEFERNGFWLYRVVTESAQ